jgi:uncharacterized Rossmann fold enzyme
MYACDDHWLDLYVNEIKRDFSGQIWTQSVLSARKYKLNLCEGQSMPGLGREKLHFGNNSGYQAINLAYLLGATKIVLSGFDMNIIGDKVHFFGSHPYHHKGQGPNNEIMKRWCANFERLAMDLEYEGVEVINASRHSALTAFKRMDLELC